MTLCGKFAKMHSRTGKGTDSAIR